MIGMILCVSDDNATVHAVKTACGRIGVDLVVVDDVGGMRPPSEETDIDVVVCDYDGPMSCSGPGRVYTGLSSSIRGRATR